MGHYLTKSLRNMLKYDNNSESLWQLPYTGIPNKQRFSDPRNF